MSKYKDFFSKYGAGDNNWDNLQEGGNGNDTLRGVDGHNCMVGGNGNDTIIGGDSGSSPRKTDKGLFGDMIFGGHGNDRITSNAGYDVIHFKKGDGKDVVTDFNLDHDSLNIVLKGTGIHGTQDLLDNHCFKDGSSVLIKLGHGDSIELEHTKLSELRAHIDDFYWYGA